MLAPLIKQYLITSAKVDPAEFDRPEAKVAELGLDSLGLIEMLFEVEDKFGFQIADPMRYQSMTFDAMVADIEAQVRAHHNGELPDIAAFDASGGAR